MLKKKAKTFLKKCQKFGVRLNEEGEIDLSEVKEDNIRQFFQKNASLVRVTLMQADLEFEYPHKLERMKVQADVYNMAVQEEEKLKYAQFAKEASEAAKKVLTYEEYFQIEDEQNINLKTSGQKGTKISYDEYLAQNQSDNLFENEVSSLKINNTFQHMELEYKFWESDEEREQRIKKVWIELKKKQALLPPTEFKKATREHQELTKEIVEMTRRVRWRIDQELTRKNVEPIFKENYYSYTKDEFMLDADFEFYKVKNLLSKSPRLLKEDPILGVDYLKIINLIKKKKLLELSSDQYDPMSAHEAHYYDV